MKQVIHRQHPLPLSDTDSAFPVEAVAFAKGVFQTTVVEGDSTSLAWVVERSINGQDWVVMESSVTLTEVGITSTFNITTPWVRIRASSLPTGMSPATHARVWFCGIPHAANQ